MRTQRAVQDQPLLDHDLCVLLQRIEIRIYSGESKHTQPVLLYRVESVLWVLAVGPAELPQSSREKCGLGALASARNAPLIANAGKVRFKVGGNSR